MMFADGACEARSRSKEKVMQGHRRRRATQRSPATPISPKGGGGTASISLSLLLYDVTDIASSLLRELDAVALVTNVMVFLGRDTTGRSLSFDLSANTLKCGFQLEKAVENLGVEVLPSLVSRNGGNLILRVSRAVEARM